MGETTKIVPEYLKGYLTDKDGVKTEVTEDIANWDDVAIRQQRDGFSGVFNTIQESITFVRSAKDLVRSVFIDNLLSSYMLFSVEQRSNYGFDYTEMYRAVLDFGTYNEEEHRLSVEAYEHNFQSFVKSYGKTNYEIPVSDLTTEIWLKSPQDQLCSANYSMPEDTITLIGTGVETAFSQTLFINLDGAEMPFNANQQYDFTSQNIDRHIWDGANPSTPPDPGTLPPEYFFKTDPGKESGRFVLSARFTLNWTTYGDGRPAYKMWFMLVQVNAGGESILYSREMANDAATKTVDIDFNLDMTAVSRGTEFKMYVWADGLGDSTRDISLSDFDHFWIRYIDAPSKTLSIPVVLNSILGQKILDLMADGRPDMQYTLSIDADADMPLSTVNHYLVAAESIRGLEYAMYYTSFDDFTEYMRFLAYEYDVDETAKTIRFSKRDVLFNPNVTAIDLTQPEVANLVQTADDSYAYSSVKVGYERPDIEEINGRFAVCGTFDYASDYVNHSFKDAIFQLQCPYKADPVEIESLLRQRGVETTDRRTDNDIFMLAGMLVTGPEASRIFTYTGSQYAVYAPELDTDIYWYNVPYIPYFIVRRNLDIIGIAVGELKFTATDSFRGATLIGAITDDIYGNFTIADGMFLPVKYEFEVGTRQGLPAGNARRGLVRFDWLGRELTGYIEELRQNMGDDQTETWILFAKTL